MAPEAPKPQHRALRLVYNSPVVPYSSPVSTHQPRCTVQQPPAPAQQPGRVHSRAHAGYRQGTDRVHTGYTQGTDRVHADVVCAVARAIAYKFTQVSLPEFR